MSKTSNGKLILGTVQMGLNYGVNNSKGKISLDNSFEIFNYAYDNGITTLDSAEAYGDAHAVIGEFHRKNKIKRFKIITKLPNDNNIEISQKVDTYLKDLNVDQLEALMFHSYQSYIDNIENINTLKELKLAKKIKKIGVSLYTNNEIKKVIQNDDIDVIQLPFNIFDNKNLRYDILKEAKKKGKIIHTRSALLQGLFYKDINDNSIIVQKLKKQLKLIFKITVNENISISELALNYCLQNNQIDNVLIGVDSVDQLAENLRSLNHELNSTTTEKINSIIIKDIDLLNPSLWN